MKKTADLLKKNIALVDLSVVVLDARVPFSAQNPLTEQILSQKPILYFLNKADLADEVQSRFWSDCLRQKKNATVISGCARKVADAKRIATACFKICPEAKTGRRGVRVLITGIPNAGKSTLINTLCGEAKAKTGDRPAVTKTMQRVLTADGLDLYDTPGLLWHKFENQETALRLAASGAIREEVLNLPDIALFSIEFLKKYYREELANRFALGSAVEEQSIRVLERIARKRGCLGKGGAVDWEKASALFLRELRAGKICRLTFDRSEEFEKLAQNGATEVDDGV